MSKVPAARILEADVISFVKSLHAQYGRAGLIAVKPGETLVDRLRYCTSRVMLERTKEVLPELERLAVEGRLLRWALCGYLVSDIDVRGEGWSLFLLLVQSAA